MNTEFSFTILTILLLTGSSILLAILDFGLMYHKVKVAQHDQRKILKATDNFKWQMITLIATYIIITATVCYKAGVPLW